MEPTRKDREFRRLESFEIRASEDSQGYILEGYALKFNSPTVLYESRGTQYKEQIDSRALQNADMTDVVLNFEHGGKVFARTRNQTLQLTVDEIGLRFRADLSGTEEGRKMYEEVRGGYIDKMSFAFTVREDSYDKNTNLRTITDIKKVYDVSLVAHPAYADTSVNARGYFEAQQEIIEQEKRKRQRLIMLTKL
jgi:HK97 family phage prohead protease